MKFYKILFLFVFASCAPIEKTTNIHFKESFTNSGFALVYDDKFFENKKIDKRLDNRSYEIFQRNLKPGTNAIIKNLLNNKTLLVTVGKNSKYPNFFNSVISKRIADELDINIDEPYIQVIEIDKNSVFLANKTKTFDEEKNVAEKAPVLEIGIKDLSDNNTAKVKKPEISIFKYVIKLGDFYFYDSAMNLKQRVNNEFKVNEVKINKLSKTKFRVYLGPYDNLNSLKNAFNKISILNFENIEIIKI